MTESPHYIRMNDYIVQMKQIRGEWIPNFPEGKIYSPAINGYMTPIISQEGYAYFMVPAMAGIRRKIYLHRALLIMKSGLPLDPDLEVDHINHDPQDNRISNLRWATPSENTRNRPEMFAQAEAIRREKEAGATTKELAEKYTYSPRMIQNIIACERYDPKKYPRDAKPQVHYTKPFAGGNLLGWCL